MTQSSSGWAFRRLGIPSIKNITNLFLVFCFIGTGLHGGIKEDVEKIIKSQYGNSIVFSMKKQSLGKQARTQIEHKVHQRFFASLAEAPIRPRTTDRNKEPIASCIVTAVPASSRTRYSQINSMRQGRKIGRAPWGPSRLPSA